MSDVLTQEIDLRKTPAKASIKMIGAGVLALIGVMFAFSRSPAPKNSELAVSGVAPSSERGHAEAKVSPANDVIVIHATPELAEEAAPAASKEEGFGKLTLTSDPSVVVYEGEKRLGRTPLKLTLSSGSHELKLVDKAKHLEVKRRVEIRAGGTHTRDLNFGIGSLKVLAPDGSKLWLNKKFAGTAPFKRLELAEGRHRLKVKSGVEVHEEWITVPPSRNVEYRVNFAD